MNKRAQFLIIKIGSQKVGLMNIYAPNSASARASFWPSLVEYVGLADCWLVGGDFNMIEEAFDRIGGTTTTISSWEAKCWDSFSFAFGLLDLWKVQSFSHIQMGVWLVLLCLGWIDFMPSVSFGMRVDPLALFWDQRYLTMTL